MVGLPGEAPAVVGDLAAARGLARWGPLGAMDLVARVGQPVEECQPLVGYLAMAPPGAVPQIEEAVAGPMVLRG
jgi:hypothetical protein